MNMAQDTSTPHETAPIMASTQPVPQTIIVTCPKKSSKKEHFKDRIALIIGIMLIISASLAIFFGGAGWWTFKERRRISRYSNGYGHEIFVPFWTAPIVYLSGAFAIVSAKTKGRGFIITTMVFNILTAVFAVPLVGISAWIIDDDQRMLPRLEPDRHYNYEGILVTESPEHFERVVSLYKGGLAIGVFLLLCAVVDFVCSIVLSAVCCAVTCCGSSEPSQVVFLNSPPGVMAVTDPNAENVPMYPANVPQASGGDFPPPYTSLETNKVNLGDDEAGACPTKASLP